MKLWMELKTKFYVMLVNKVAILIGTMVYHFLCSFLLLPKWLDDYKTLPSDVGYSHHLAAFKPSGYKNIDISNPEYMFIGNFLQQQNNLICSTQNRSLQTASFPSLKRVLQLPKEQGEHPLQHRTAIIVVAFINNVHVHFLIH